jgi:hypothetical protein
MCLQNWGFQPWVLRVPATETCAFRCVRRLNIGQRVGGAAGLRTRRRPLSCACAPRGTSPSCARYALRAACAASAASAGASRSARNVNLMLLPPLQSSWRNACWLQGHRTTKELFVSAMNLAQPLLQTERKQARFRHAEQIHRGLMEVERCRREMQRKPRSAPVLDVACELMLRCCAFGPALGLAHTQGGENTHP